MGLQSKTGTGNVENSNNDQFTDGFRLARGFFDGKKKYSIPTLTLLLFNGAKVTLTESREVFAYVDNLWDESSPTSSHRR